MRRCLCSCPAALTAVLRSALFSVSFSMVLAAALIGCAARPAGISDSRPDAGPQDTDRQNALPDAGSMRLRYAEQFTVDYEAGGSALVTIGGTERFRLVPEGTDAPASDGAAVLRVPLQRIYLADSASMDLFARLDALDRIRLTSTKQSDWRLDEPRRAMEDGTLLYAGKYSAPDYELLLSEGTELALENTMIWHSPETREQLEALGIPVLVGRLSYEPHPLGRLEWIRLCGLLVGKGPEAEAWFDTQAALAESIAGQEDTGKTAALFSVSANGVVKVRRPEDYLVRLIGLAGGRYAFPDLAQEDGGARSTIDMQAEAFAAGAMDADILIYNGTIDGGMETLDRLLAKCGWLAGARAVREGNVWCTEPELYQKTSSTAAVLEDFRAVLSGAPDEGSLRFLHRLR